MVDGTWMVVDMDGWQQLDGNTGNTLGTGSCNMEHHLEPNRWVGWMVWLSTPVTVDGTPEHRRMEHLVVGRLVTGTWNRMVIPS